MRKFLVLTVLSSLLGIVPCTWAADNGGGASSGASSSDSSSGSSNGGGWRGQGGGGGFRRGGGMGRGAGGKLHRVLSLQSLTPDQRKQIQSILSDLKTESKPLREQMEAQGGWSGNGGGASNASAPNGKTASAASTGGGRGAGGGKSGGAGPSGGGPNADIRHQIGKLHMAAWSKIEAILTPAQLKELDNSSGSEGELVPKKGGMPDPVDQ